MPSLKNVYCLCAAVHACARVHGTALLHACKCAHSRVHVFLSTIFINTNDLLMSSA